jgi:hypothetical protein
MPRMLLGTGRAPPASRDIIAGLTRAWPGIGPWSSNSLPAEESRDAHRRAGAVAELPAETWVPAFVYRVWCFPISPGGDACRE